MTITELEETQATAFTHFKALIAAKVEGATEWHWYRACSAICGENTRRNVDQSHDIALATDEKIQDAFDSYLTKLHAFYRARDGEHGVLGSRGL